MGLRKYFPFTFSHNVLYYCHPILQWRKLRALQKIAGWIRDYAIPHDCWRGGGEGLFQVGPLGGLWADCSCLNPQLKQEKEKILLLLCPCPSLWSPLSHQSWSYIVSLSDCGSMGGHAWPWVQSTEHPALCSHFPQACLSLGPRLAVLLLTSKDKCGAVFQSRWADLINFRNKQHEDSSRTFRYEQQ